MSDPIRAALDALPVQGLALKRHIVRMLLDFQDGLTNAQLGKSGPARNAGSVVYALRALQRIGVVTLVPKADRKDFDRWRLAQGVSDSVRAFLTTDRNTEPPSLTPLPLRDRYQPILKVVCGSPERSFSVNDLLHMIPGGKEVTVRKIVVELHEAGYLLRGMSDEDKPGRPTYGYRLNPDAEQHARAQFDWRAEAAL